MNFIGNISSSKSLMNRALIMQSWNPELEIDGFSDCDDVVEMRTSLQVLHKNLGADFYLYAGNAGTTFRFLCFRVSRIPGNHIIEMGHQISKRPQTEIISLLAQLGVNCEMIENQFRIQSYGWKIPEGGLTTDASISSQYLSGLFLSCVDLPESLTIQSTSKHISSQLYLQMTIELMEKVGFKVESKGSSWFIEKNQKMPAQKILVEPDYSSVVAVSICAALTGSICIQNVGLSSLQPDYRMLGLLAGFGIDLHWKRNESSPDTGYSLIVNKSFDLKSCELDLREMPDTFPVISVLCSAADGTSKLIIPDSLIHKESNRLLEVQKLLDLIETKYSLVEGVFSIHGSSLLANKIAKFNNSLKKSNSEFTVDPAKDHRMAMAYGILLKLGYQFTISDKNCVNKSFPDFWKVIGL